MSDLGATHPLTTATTRCVVLYSSTSRPTSPWECEPSAVKWAPHLPASGQRATPLLFSKSKVMLPDAIKADARRSFASENHAHVDN